MARDPRTAPRARYVGLSLAAATLGVLFGACRSAPTSEPFDASAAIEESFDAAANGDFETAAARAEQVLMRCDRSTSQGSLDSFRAALSAADAHWRAAAGAPFLREPSASGEPTPSSTAHALETMHYFAIARSVAPRAVGAANEAEIATALREANLMELALHSQLGLRSSAQAVLARSPHLHDARACADLATRAPLAGRRPWLYLALFEFQRSRDEMEAYRFAVMAIDEAPSAAPGFDAQRVAELERWILGESTLEYHCPRCDLAVTPALRACPNDRTPNVEFVGRKRL